MPIRGYLARKRSPSDGSISEASPSFGVGSGAGRFVPRLERGAYVFGTVGGALVSLRNSCEQGPFEAVVASALEEGESAGSSGLRR